MCSTMTFNLIIVAILVVLGILLLLIEFFLLPGISIAGIGGALFMVGGVIYAYIYLGSTAGNVTLALSLFLLALSFVWLLKSKSLQKIALTADIEETVDNSNLKSLRPGDTGITLSRLNPIGKVMIGEVTVEGKSFDGELIDEDTEIEVVRVESYNVTVKRRNGQ
ncbi:putative membrane protein {ECO:0000313/EMBL:CEA16647,1} [Petrimonas mucosa]|jgi:membrane-bound ClpP family serine protease|uniref:Putative membrane protein n=2 Tax=Dysgonomonadaceae TaxID=2005520 RepID=A0A1G4G4J2_9BACT|nr:putative membrane protein {ECO:0000313/EMBL:CEA16647,1} [Petrimonas mucosa]